jgi:hypothetical protein
MAGCATPRYETITRYESPVGAAGQACVKGCEAALDTCRTQCQAAWQACTERVEPQVDERYAQALEKYAEELRRYRLDLDRYQWDLWVGWGHGYSGLWYSPWPYHPWPGYHPGYYPPPIEPGDPPTKASVRDGLRRSQCQDDCGCQTKHDACFEGCGGRVVTEPRCVANCPGGK